MTLFAALSDEIRRSILEVLVEGEFSAGEIASAFPSLTRQAISSHLQILLESDLVAVRRESQKRLYRLNPESLRPIEDWLRDLRKSLPRERPGLRRLRRRK